MKTTKPLLLALAALSAPLSHASTSIPDAAQYTTMSNGVVAPSPETYYVPAPEPSATPAPTSSNAPTPGVTTGWDGTTYYINGQATTLDKDGNGSQHGIFYSAGHSTTTIGSDTNIWGNGVQGNGEVIGSMNDGWDGSKSVKSYLDQYGNGWALDNNANYVQYNGGIPSNFSGSLAYVNYVNGKPFIDPNAGQTTTGWDGYAYYINGKITALDQNGNGSSNGNFYQGGNVTACLSCNYVLDPNWDGQTALLIVPNSLDKNGNGTSVDGVPIVNGVPEGGWGFSATYNGKTWVNGVLQH